MDSGKSSDSVSEYEARIHSEIGIYRDCVDVHNLPPIFHYWSNRYIRPQLERRGFRDPAGMFLLALEEQCAKQEQCAKHAGETARFLSAGSGNCELEVKVAAGLRARGYDNFVIECLDLNRAMLKRGSDAAKQRGVTTNLEFVEADLNRWVASREYNAVIADQSLHHVMDLESLFGQIRQALRPDGVFVISDMIGRNGHLRWPEALTIVRDFWSQLPPSYRRNCQSGRYEAFFGDADCSTESFEGIRAQEIVPLLTEYFHFRFFLGFGNVIDPFIDRSFGPHFNPANAWDREFIDEVHRRDEEEMAAGRLQPTHMLAILGTQPDAAPALGAFAHPRVHVSGRDVPSVKTPESGYAWGSWPHSAEAELKHACRIIEDSENRNKILERELGSAIARAQQHEIEFRERTAWALRLDSQQKADALANEAELVKRTLWAHRLEAELSDRTAWALRLDGELTERTEWVVRMERELADLTRRTSLYVGIGRYLRSPFRLARRLLGGNAGRVRKLPG